MCVCVSVRVCVCVCVCRVPQVLDASLEAAVLRSDNSSLAKDCRKEIKTLNQQLLKLGPR